MKNKSLQLLQVGNIIAVILTIFVNGLANILPIGDKYTGELSDNIPNLFVPAGITFAIWGIIFEFISEVAHNMVLNNDRISISSLKMVS